MCRAQRKISELAKHASRKATATHAARAGKSSKHTSGSVARYDNATPGKAAVPQEQAMASGTQLQATDTIDETDLTTQSGDRYALCRCLAIVRLSAARRLAHVVRAASADTLCLLLGSAIISATPLTCSRLVCSDESTWFDPHIPATMDAGGVTTSPRRADPAPPPPRTPPTRVLPPRRAASRRAAPSAPPPPAKASVQLKCSAGMALPPLRHTNAAHIRERSQQLRDAELWARRARRSAHAVRQPPPLPGMAAAPPVALHRSVETWLRAKGDALACDTASRQLAMASAAGRALQADVTAWKARVAQEARLPSLPDSCPLAHEAEAYGQEVEVHNEAHRESAAAARAAAVSNRGFEGIGDSRFAAAPWLQPKYELLHLPMLTPAERTRQALRHAGSERMWSKVERRDALGAHSRRFACCNAFVW